MFNKKYKAGDQVVFEECGGELISTQSFKYHWKQHCAENNIQGKLSAVLGSAVCMGSAEEGSLMGIGISAAAAIYGILVVDTNMKQKDNTR